MTLIYRGSMVLGEEFGEAKDMDTYYSDTLGCRCDICALFPVFRACSSNNTL